MDTPPRKSSDPIITKGLIARVLMSACIIMMGTLLVFAREMSDNIITPRDTTMTFATFVTFDLFNALSSRSADMSIFSVGLMANEAFMWAAGGSYAGLLMIIYLPFLQAVFQTEALALTDLLQIIAVASTVLWADEIRKAVSRRQAVQRDHRIRKMSSNTITLA